MCYASAPWDGFKKIGCGTQYSFCIFMAIFLKGLEYFCKNFPSFFFIPTEKREILKVSQYPKGARYGKRKKEDETH